MDSSAEGVTSFHKSLEDLGIESILAHSPQAKGRVERANRTLQERLVKELRLRNCSSIAEGNLYLQEYILAHNARFAVPPSSGLNCHQPLSDAENERLELILSTKTGRSVSANLVVQFEREYYQLCLPTAGHRIKKSGVFVCRTRHNEVIITDFPGQIVPYKKIVKPLAAPKICDAKAIENPSTLPLHRTLDQKIRRLPASVFRDYAKKFPKNYAI